MAAGHGTSAGGICSLGDQSPSVSSDRRVYGQSGDYGQHRTGTGSYGGLRLLGIDTALSDSPESGGVIV